MATVPTRPPNRTGAVAADARKRRPPIWLWLLLLLLALLLLAWLLYAILHKTHHKKTSTASPVASTAPSTTVTPSPSNPSATAIASPSAVSSTNVTAGPGAATASYGAALIGGGAVAAVPATGTEAAAASSAAGVTSTTGASGARSAAPGPQGTVLFASNSAVINSAGLQVIEAAAIRIKALHPTAVTVTGYTDVVGGQPKNVNLSQQRADAVARVLRQDLGTATPSITAVARGEADPIAPNSTSAGRQQNRRASIVSG